MPTLFSRIVSGEIQCHKIAETHEYFAFLDIMPLAPGHTLVIPKREVDYIFDLRDEELSGLIQFSKKIAAALEKAVPCLRIGVSVIGLEVAHAHIHLIPLNSIDDINFSRPKLKPTTEELSATAEKIKSHLK